MECLCILDDEEKEWARTTVVKTWYRVKRLQQDGTITAEELTEFAGLMKIVEKCINAKDAAETS
jgi:hypothetical protein